MKIDPILKNNKIAKKAANAGQEHIFKFWSELDQEQHNRLLIQTESIDFDLVADLKRKYIDDPDRRLFKGRIEPTDVIRVPKTDVEKKAEFDAKVAGESLLRSGKVATLLVAGGLGTRLGYAHPKGMFALGPITGRSLFQYHAEKILALRRRFEAEIPWYIMTSIYTHDETIAYFDSNNYFSLPKQDIFFFTQDMFPALDERGKLFLDAKDHIFTNPNGHGGTIQALAKSGALSDMRKRGIEEIFYFQVDNALIKICDPVFLGYHVQASAEMSAKVVPKKHPLERLGVIGRIDGRIGVIEYSDLSVEDQQARNPDGQLKYRDGSIAIHILNVGFVEKLNQGGLHLPFHVAHKRIPFIDNEGRLVNPDSPNGYKFEYFIFDALAQAREVVVMEVVREDEFSPVKNKQGDDSPQTARRDLTNMFGRWLEAAGVHIPRDSEEHVEGKIEISPLFAMDRDELVAKVDRNLSFDGNLVLE